MTTYQSDRSEKNLNDKKNSEEVRGGGGGVKAELHGRPCFPRAEQPREDDHPERPLHSHHEQPRDPENVIDWQERYTALEQQLLVLKEEKTVLKEENTVLKEEITALKLENTVLNQEDLNKGSGKKAQDQQTQTEDEIKICVNCGHIPLLREKVLGDGNCLFRSVGRAHPQYCEEDHFYLRRETFKWCQKNWRKYGMTTDQLNSIGMRDHPVPLITYICLADMLNIELKVHALSSSCSWSIKPDGLRDHTLNLYCDFDQRHFDALVDDA